MSSQDTVGTLRSVVYGGIEFRTKDDASISEMLRDFVCELIVTSGKPMQQKIKSPKHLDGFPFVMNQEERKKFNALADSAPHKFVYEDASGYIISGQAIITGDSTRTSNEGIYTCNIYFTDDKINEFRP